MTDGKIRKFQISGRELYLGDNLVDQGLVTQAGLAVKQMHFLRKERAAPMFRRWRPPLISIRRWWQMIPFPASQGDRAESVSRRDAGRCARLCEQRRLWRQLFHSIAIARKTARNVTVLYYANLLWQPDWGGETIFYNDEQDAVLAVSPKAGRVVVGRGAILHRAAKCDAVLL